MTTPIPSPPGYPLIGHMLGTIDRAHPGASLAQLAAKYGPIYKLTIMGSNRIFLTNRAMVDEACDEKRFHKHVAGPLKEVRNGAGDGLFTAFHGEENWGIARTLLRLLSGR